jgi:hypothetical protein
LGKFPSLGDKNDSHDLVNTVDGRNPAPPNGWLKHVETLKK